MDPNFIINFTSNEFYYQDKQGLRILHGHWQINLFKELEIITRNNKTTKEEWRIENFKSHYSQNIMPSY